MPWMWHVLEGRFEVVLLENWFNAQEVHQVVGIGLIGFDDQLHWEPYYVETGLAEPVSATKRLHKELNEIKAELLENQRNMVIELRNIRNGIMEAAAAKSIKIPTNSRPISSTSVSAYWVFPELWLLIISNVDCSKTFFQTDINKKSFGSKRFSIPRRIRHKPAASRISVRNGVRNAAERVNPNEIKRTEGVLTEENLSFF